MKGSNRVALSKEIGIAETGKKYVTKEGCTVTVKKYVDAKNVIVVFDDGVEITVQKSQLVRGNIKNRNLPSIYGVGFLGIGGYVAKKDGKHSEMYKFWIRMLARCYDLKYQSKHQSYIGCTVSKEWHNFQNFAHWLEKESNYTEGWHLDKDLIITGNKEYSPTACCFIPQSLNSFLSIESVRNKTGIIGVELTKSGKWKAQITDLEINKKKQLGVFETSGEAEVCYKKARIKNMRIMIDRLKEVDTTGVIEKSLLKKIKELEVKNG